MNKPTCTQAIKITNGKPNTGFMLMIFKDEKGSEYAQVFLSETVRYQWDLDRAREWLKSLIASGYKWQALAIK